MKLFIDTNIPMHAAVMRHGDLEKILSVDRDFDRIAGVERIDPLEFD